MRIYVEIAGISGKDKKGKFVKTGITYDTQTDSEDEQITEEEIAEFFQVSPKNVRIISEAEYKSKYN